MSVDRIMAGAVAAAGRAGRRAVAEAGAVLALRAAAIAGIDAEAMDDVVRLRGRALRVRAFGGRDRAADPRLAGLVTGEGE